VGRGREKLPLTRLGFKLIEHCIDARKNIKIKAIYYNSCPRNIF